MRSTLVSIMPVLEEHKFELGLIYALSFIVVLIQLVPILVPANFSSSVASLARPASTTTSNPAITAAEAKSSISKRTTASSAAQASSKATASSANNATDASSQQSSSKVWPMRGRVSAEFGVPHQPWQRTHTGIDIISVGRSGAARVTTFKTGKVIDTIASSRGLGNRVIISHGNNITSVYAHLSNINVRKGQSVKPGDTLGREGTSGATRGRHLHFEIRHNGQPVKPRNYIPGQPNS